jgi:2-hydroxychromene-2-carboxylate isomerase
MLEATRRQDKFWPAVEAAHWQPRTDGQVMTGPTSGSSGLRSQAAGIDIERVRADMQTDAVKTALAQDIAALTALKVQQTPTFYVNGKPLLDFGAEQLKALVSSEVKAAYGD